MTEQNIYKSLGEKMRELRKKAKMTQDEVAQKAGIHRTEISAFESRGEQIRSFEKIQTILNCLGYDFDITEKKTPLMSA
jgi:transcriptional regulator with XRE-family HTH domain